MSEQATGTQQVQAVSPAWSRIERARHPQRPYPMDFVERIFTDFSEIHGDRAFGDDEAVACGMARLGAHEVMVIGNRKGGTTKERVRRNFGMPHPEGYRKALRCMKIAEKFGRPVISLIDLPGAYPGLGAEERGQAEAIARNIREMSRLRVPTISVISGEGGSGGALALAVSDRVLILENALYFVITPESCAAIMWRDAAHKQQAAEAMRISAPEVAALGCVDEIVREPRRRSAYRSRSWSGCARYCAAEASDRTQGDSARRDRRKAPGKVPQDRTVLHGRLGRGGASAEQTDWRSPPTFPIGWIARRRVARWQGSMPMSTAPFVGGRTRAYLEFVAAVIFFFLARSVAHHSAAGLTNELWTPLAEQAILLFLLVLGFAAFGLVFDRQKHPVSEQGLPFRPGWPGEAGLGLAVGWAAAVLCVLPLTVAGGIAVVLSTQPSAWGWLVADAVFFALAAMVEEVAFRGYGFQRFVAVVGPVGRCAWVRRFLCSACRHYSRARAKSVSLYP